MNMEIKPDYRIIAPKVNVTKFDLGGFINLLNTIEVFQKQKLDDLDTTERAATKAEKIEAIVAASEISGILALAALIRERLPNYLIDEKNQERTQPQTNWRNMR